MQVIVTTRYLDKDSIYAGNRHTENFTSFTKLYSYIVKIYKQAKLTGNYVKVETILK